METSDTSDTSTRASTAEAKGRMIHGMRKSGIVSRAAEAANIHRDTHYQWLKDDPVYAESIDRVKEYMVGKLTERLHTLADEGNVQAVIFGLRTLGKDHGFSDKPDPSVYEIPGIQIIQKFKEDGAGTDADILGEQE